MSWIAATESIRSRPVLAFSVALLLCLLALGSRFVIGDVLAGYPFLTFFPAVVIAAFLGGLLPGLVAGLLGGALAKFFLIDPVGTLAPSSPDAAIGLLFYALTVTIIVVLTHALLTALDSQKRAEESLRRLNADLEGRIDERSIALEAEMAERYAAEAQVRQMQKMESIGQLTGGIAHDFNNMLAIVTGSLDMARRRLTGAEHPKVLACIDAAAEGARRAAALTARLLAFARQQPLAPQPIDANRLVGGMSELLRRTLGADVRIETVLAGGLWAAYADPAQLENTIVNLAVNARDAMPAGGNLTIETANTDLDERYARNEREVRAGHYVMVSVTDNGGGMSPEVMERAFEPFFTTKGAGKGTGLGLSQVFGFVKQSGGHVKIYSELGHGTTVKIYLPRHFGGGADVAAGPQMATARADGGGATILVVEDDGAVRRMTVDALRELGYRVVEAAGGGEGLACLAAHPPFDLLLTDIVMPGMNGRQLADAARREQPGLRVLYTTGYTRNAVVHNGILDPGVAFLPKPFTLEQLAAKIRDALASDG